MCLGIPGKVLELREQNGMRFGSVQFAGITREVCFECLPGAEVGDYVLVHVGFAISKIDPELAETTYRTLEELGMADEVKVGAEPPSTTEVGS